MKNLIFINGTMGVGKTTTAKLLQQQLPNCVFLDGDWCWDSSPFIVTDSTKSMVLQNISFLLNNFLSCPDYENIIFCWVMHQQNIIDQIIQNIASHQFCFSIFTLTASSTALKTRILRDVHDGKRTLDVLERSLERQAHYTTIKSIKIDVTTLLPQEAVDKIIQILPQSQIGQF